METAAPPFFPPLLQVLVATVAAFVLGGLWYSALFAKVWQRETGLSDETLGAANPAKIFGPAFVLIFIAAWVFGMFLGPEPALPFAVGAGFAAGLFWVGASFGVNDLFERRSFKLWAINAGYHTLVFTVFGLIFGLWH